MDTKCASRYDITVPNMKLIQFAFQSHILYFVLEVVKKFKKLKFHEYAPRVFFFFFFYSWPQWIVIDVK